MNNKSSMRQWFKSGDPWIWMIGGGLAISLIMVVGLLLLIAVRGFGHFWPAPILSTSVTTAAGESESIMGIMVRSETLPAQRVRESGQDIPADQPLVTRHLIKVGNRDLTGRDFVWYLDSALGELHYPEDALRIERREWGNFYGFARGLERGGEVVARGEALWPQLLQAIDRANELHQRIQTLERVEIGRINRKMEELRLERRALELEGVSGAELAAAEADFAARQAELDRRFADIQAERRELMEQSARDVLIADRSRVRHRETITWTKRVGWFAVLPPDVMLQHLLPAVVASFLWRGH